MQMQYLNTAALTGLGTVLSQAEEAEGTACSRQFRSGEQTERLRAEKSLVVDYESEMSLLILHGAQSLVFYLDRAVRLAPRVVFSIVPLEASCTVRFYLQPGDELHTEGFADDSFLHSAAPQLQISKLYTCFFQESTRDFYFRGERHAPYELTYVDQGRLHNLVNGTDIVLRQQELSIIGRGDWHIQYSDEPVSFLTVTFDLPGDALDGVVGKQLSLPSSARETLKKILKERTSRQPYSYDYLEALLKILLVELLRSSSAARPAHTAAALPSTARAENQIVDRALQIISERIDRRLTVTELAGAVHVSVPYLCRLFDTHLGMPPGQYITKIRLEECKVLLRQGELSMSDIAKKMGFSSAQHFSRQFHHCCGLTPTEYTRSLR